MRAPLRGRWYQSISGEWFKEGGDTLDRFSEDYVNDPEMTVERFVARLDRWLSKHGVNKSLPEMAKRG